jgi:xanthine permease
MESSQSAVPLEPHPVDKIYPPGKTFSLGLQFVLVMYAGAVTVPLIVGRALNLSADDLAFLISADLLGCGIATIIQALGIWKFGARLPLMMGVTFVAIGPMIAIGSNADLGLRGIYGATIAAGIFTVLIAPVLGRLRHFLPPVVTGTVILVIGITLMKTGINWAAGGNPTLPGPGNLINPEYGKLSNIAIASFVIVTAIAVLKWGRGFMTNIAVLIALVVGFIAALALGRVTFQGVAEAPWIAVVQPFHYGWPIFEPVAILSMCLAMLVVTVESSGMLMAIGKTVGRPIDGPGLAAGLRADGLGTIIGGILNTFPYTTYSQNVGLVNVIGVYSRYVCVAAGVILCMLGFLPKMSHLIVSIPIYVFGGASLFIFGVCAAAGLKVLTEVDFSKNRHNLYIAGTGIALGMIPLLAPNFFKYFPAWSSQLTHSGILLCTVGTALLNWLLNGASSSGQEPTSQLSDSLQKAPS